MKQEEKNTLVLVEKHGSLYEISPFLPVQYKSLRPLGNFHFWTEENRWARLLLTSTAHGRFESQVLDPNYRHECVEYVGLVSKIVFSRLLALYPGLSKLGMIDEMAKAANRVPRELRHLVDFFVESKGSIEAFVCDRVQHSLCVVSGYYDSRAYSDRDFIYRGLKRIFLDGTGKCELGWEFLDLGLVYRLREGRVIRHHGLCPPARTALLELFKRLPIPMDERKMLSLAPCLSKPLSCRL